jgi:CBS domain-containing protein
VVAPNNRVKDAAKTMEKHRVHHPVVMEDDKVIGMLSAIDSIKVFATLD